VGFLLIAPADSPLLAHQPQPPRPDTLILERWGPSTRTPFRRDPLEATIASGAYSIPQLGAILPSADGVERTWREPEHADAGSFKDGKAAGGYASVIIRREEPGIELLHATGHGMVYINGVPRVGDAYGLGFVTLPIELREGDNELLFAIGREGLVRYSLSSPAAVVSISTSDPTLPDVLINNLSPLWGAAVILNAGNTAAQDLALEAVIDGGKPMVTVIPPIVPLGTFKAPFKIDVTGAMTDEPTLSLRLIDLGPDEAPSTDAARAVTPPLTLGPAQTFKLRRVRPTQPHTRTFISGIDGSVQYYAVNPAISTPTRAPGDPKQPPAIILSLHGAGVQATNQAAAYSPKRWAHIVAPTNRRAFGFDWEDWGRLDALEVLADAKRYLYHNPTRTYLTGHSMGGHGTWQLGVLYPDLFAAIGPSAGWVDFASYSGPPLPSDPTPMQAIFLRARAGSDTLAMKANLSGRGVYILHGDADDNVPVDHARRMREELKDVVPGLGYHEQPGAGHWWESSDEPGAECLDWAPMFDLFAHYRSVSDREVRSVRFVTMNPAISDRLAWVTIGSQVRPGEPSTVSIECDPHAGRFKGTTTNVESLELSLAALVGTPTSVELDGDRIEVPKTAAKSLFLQRGGSAWELSSGPDLTNEVPNRSGPFKQAFNHRALLVYGTHGSPAENAAMLAKARFDSESFWYRGNGSFEVASDEQCLSGEFEDRSIILYGNSNLNRAWAPLLGGSPVDVRSGAVQVGDRTYPGDALACLVIRPRHNDFGTSVAGIGGTGLAGLRLTERLPYFLSGVGYPDFCVFGPEVLSTGIEGVKAAGYFRNDWSLNPDDMVEPE